MKIQTISLWLALFSGLALVSCGDDDPVTMRPVPPSNGGASVRSITRLGSVESGYDWQFSYSDGRLVQANGLLRDPSPTIDQGFRYTSSISYKGSAVSMSSTNGEKIGLTLNSSGCVSQMTVNRNVYNFHYNDNGQLTQWSKLAFEETLGQVQQYTSSGTISYNDAGALQRIVYTGTDNRRTVLTFDNASQANVNGILPPTISREMGCLGFEQLYYAGLLGRSPKLLVQRIAYEYPDAQPAVPSTSTSFEYGYHNGNVTLCNYHTASGSVASVSYGY